MKNENKVLACVDHSRYADHVAGYAAWAARRMNAPLEFLHVIDSHPERGTGDDHSGAIGIDAQENLLAQLSAEDEVRAKSAREQGRLFLNWPILTVIEDFKTPERVMIAFDGGTVTRRSIEMVAGSPLFRGLPILLLMSGRQGEAVPTSLDWARSTLEAAGFEVTVSLAPGEAGEAIARTVREQAIDILVMGTFGHLPLRSLLFGSKATELLRSSRIPTLLLR